MTLRLGGDGAITGCTSLEEPTISISGLTMTTPIEAISGTAAAPSYTFSGDTDNGLYYAGTNSIGLSTGGTNAILIDSSGRVGIGTTTVDELLHLEGSTSNVRVKVESTGTNSYPGVRLTNDARTYDIQIDGATDNLRFYDATTASERVAIDSSGRLLVGTATARTNLNDSGIETKIQIEGAGNDDSAALSIIANSGTTNSDKRTGLLVLGRTRGTSIGSNTAVVQDDAVGMIEFKGNDGTNFVTAATIKAQVDGTIGTNDMPGRLVFSTTADGASSSTERMRIDSSGRVGIGTTSPSETLEVNSGTGNTPLKLVSTDSAAYIQIEDDATTAANRIGAIGNNIVLHTNGSEKVRLDSSGRLLVGTSSGSGDDIFIVKGYTGVANGEAQIGFRRGGGVPVAGDRTLGQINFQGGDADYKGAWIRAVSDATWSAGSSHPSRLEFSTTANGASSPTARFTIYNYGLGSQVSTNHAHQTITTQGAGTSTFLYRGHYSNGTISFNVWSNGNVQNTNNSYGAISDIKLKENIVDASSQWDDLKALQVRNYNFKEGQTHTQIGLVAQEVELVSPGLVSESPDRDEEGNDLGTVTKSVNYSVLYMKAVKALQEAMERIETLEAKVADLEGQ